MNVLARKTRSAQAIPPEPAGPVVQRALRQAMDRQLGVDVLGGDVVCAQTTIAEVVADVADGDMMMWLTRDDSLSGVAMISADLWPALVELQTLGIVMGSSNDRAPGGTDVALMAEWMTAFFDGVLMADGGSEVEGWLAQLAPGRKISLPRVPELTLPDGPVRRLDVACTLVDSGKEGRLTFAMLPPDPPADGAGATPEDAWAGQWRPLISGVSTRIEAVLHRLEIPIDLLRDFSVGQVVPLDGATVDGVTLETSDGRVVATARLGRAGTMRAVRLQAPPAPEMEALTPGMAEGLGAAGAMGADPLSLPGDGMGMGDGPGLMAEEPAGMAMPDMPAMPDLSATDAPAGGLPDLSDAGGLGDMPAMPDLSSAGAEPAPMPDLPSMPDLSDAGGGGGLGDLPAMPDLSTAGAEPAPMPDLPPMPDLSDAGEGGGLPDLSAMQELPPLGGG